MGEPGPAGSDAPPPATPPGRGDAGGGGVDAGAAPSQQGSGLLAGAMDAARGRAADAGEALAQVVAPADQAASTAARDAVGGAAAAAGGAARAAGDAVASPGDAARGLVDSVREGLKVRERRVGGALPAPLLWIALLSPGLLCYRQAQP
jgi:hypothetical protein